MSRATRQGLAVVSLLALLAAVVVTAVAIPGDLLRLVGAVLLLLVAVVAAWFGMVRRASKRLVGLLVAGACIVGVVALAATADAHGLALVLVVALAAVSAGTAKVALREDLAAVVPDGELVGAAVRPVLIMNLRSGGGKAERFHLEDECRARGIEPVVLRPGDDLRQLAADAVARGADVIGMAGGDGSQALVASVAAEHDVAHVCIPAGTRNHFALDLGLDRDDVVGALDAYAAGYERRIDLATVNGRVFVNNVSLGVYAEIVQSPDYRDAKRQTTTSMLPELLGPTAEPFDVHFDGPDGRRHDGAQVIQVSNNRYVLTSLTGFGTRARLDEGVLGIAAAHITRDTQVASFVALEATGRLDRFDGWREWTAPAFTVDSASPVAAGVDGEALRLDPPLEFRSWPAAVRVRVPTHAPGRSPAARVEHRGILGTVGALVRTAAGHAD